VIEQIDIPSDGFVRFVDMMGGDSAIVQAARVSYGEGTKTVNDDTNLIRYLLRHRHTTPFEMVEFKFHIRIPMDTWRQMIRHRTASVNEYSTRYSEAIDSMKTTGIDEWRIQGTGNKQGSSGFLPLDRGTGLSDEERELQAEIRRVYKRRLATGVAREQARKDLPLSTYTEAYWKIDLHNLFHYLRLRLDSHAQKEIRDYANAIYKLIQPRVPLACAAFQDYVLDSLVLTGPEIRALLSDDWSELTKRERVEFAPKLKRLGMPDRIKQ
jgi:thymidylate synthase (FAD)